MNKRSVIHTNTHLGRRLIFLPFYSYTIWRNPYTFRQNPIQFGETTGFCQIVCGFCLNCTPCQGHFWFLVSIILDTPLLVPHNWTFRFYCSFGALSFVVCLWHIMPGHRQLPPPLTVPQMDVVSYLPTATNSGTDFTIRPPSDPQS